MACDGASGEVGYIQLFRSGTLHLSLHFLAGQTFFFNERNRDVVPCFQLSVAQKETLLERAELLSELPRGFVHTE